MFWQLIECTDWSNDYITQLLEKVGLERHMVYKIIIEKAQCVNLISIR